MALVSAALLLSFGTSIAVSANDEVVIYTPEQQQILDQMGEREKEYRDYGKQPLLKLMLRISHGQE